MINRELIRLKVLQLVYAYYQNEGKALNVAEKELDFSLGKAYELYEYLLNLLVELRRYGERKLEAAQSRAQRFGKEMEGVSADGQMARNKFLLALEENKALAGYREKKPTWEEEPQFIRGLYTAFTESETFQRYLGVEDFSFEADREVIRRLYKTLLADNDELDAMLETHSLYWNDDRPVVDTFVMKSIKRFTSASTPDDPLLPDYDSENDRVFAKTLFRETLLRREQTRALIAENCRGWEYERLALMDVVVMQIALTEMLVFPEIPLSVTFSEYLDLARVYSTPRSPGYINGLLDHIAKKLREEQVLLK
ncbi:MAG: transcription antitermination protein NusB [Alloprevotella sp.]|nr:transcription antitermination protein NusB [Alloprevotella sp.]MBR1651820.1 transcription antitermination protein NusB [Alloprevotella sp.]